MLPLTAMLMQSKCQFDYELCLKVQSKRMRCEMEREGMRSASATAPGRGSGNASLSSNWRSTRRTACRSMTKPRFVIALRCNLDRLRSLLLCIPYRCCMHTTDIPPLSKSSAFKVAMSPTPNTMISSKSSLQCWPSPCLLCARTQTKDLQTILIKQVRLWSTECQYGGHWWRGTCRVFSLSILMQGSRGF